MEEFYRAVAGEAWVDRGYVPEDAHRMLQEEASVRAASLDQIRSMLTFCLRGERFSDGHWAEMIEEGHIRRLLERLAELRAGGAAGTTGPGR